MRTDRVSQVPLRPPDARSPGGFTIIELMVVVAIITLLMGLLLPSLRKARDNAKLTVCKHNLHDLGLAMTAYAHSHPPWFPPTPYVGSIIWQAVDNPAADDNLFVLWHARYARDPNIFTCPATTHRIRTPSRIEKVQTSLGFMYVVHTAGSPGHVNDFERLGQYSGTKGHGTSYEYNVWTYVPGTLTRLTWWHVKTVNKVYADSMPYHTNLLSPAPWEKDLLADADDGDWMARAMNLGGITGSNGQAVNNWPEPWDNHGVVSRNVVYADGHAVTIKYWPSR